MMVNTQLKQNKVLPDICSRLFGPSAGVRVLSSQRLTHGGASRPHRGTRVAGGCCSGGRNRGGRGRRALPCPVGGNSSRPSRAGYR